MKFDVIICSCFGRGVGAGVGRGIVDEVNIGVDDGVRSSDTEGFEI